MYWGGRARGPSEEESVPDEMHQGTPLRDRPRGLYDEKMHLLKGGAPGFCSELEVGISRLRAHS